MIIAVLRYTVTQTERGFYYYCRISGDNTPKDEDGSPIIQTRMIYYFNDLMNAGHALQ
jgi:hypothetical protein